MNAFGSGRVPNKPPGFKGFNPYSAGRKVYGGGRSMPNIGPVQNRKGYSERDNKAAARKKALLRRLGGQMSGSPMNPKILTSDWRGGY